MVGYRRWQGAIRDGLGAMKARGALVESADVDQLAMALLAALQGGLLLAKTFRDDEPLRTALNATIDHIGSFATLSRRSAVDHRGAARCRPGIPRDPARLAPPTRAMLPAAISSL